VFTFWAIAALVTATGIAMASAIRRQTDEHRRLRAWMLATQRSTIAEATEGAVVRLVGTVVFLDGQSVEAVVTGRRCALYEAVLENVSEEVGRETGGVAFAIDDGTGRAVVDPDLARVTLYKDAVGRGEQLVNPTERERAFLSRHMPAEDAWMAKRLYGWREGVLEEGERIAVCGVVIREADPSPNALRDYRQDAVRIRIAGGKHAPVAISDEADLTR
jgi:hypothetical protein